MNRTGCLSSGECPEVSNEATSASRKYWSTASLLVARWVRSRAPQITKPQAGRASPELVSGVRPISQHRYRSDGTGGSLRNVSRNTWRSSNR